MQHHPKTTTTEENTKDSVQSLPQPKRHAQIEEARVKKEKERALTIDVSAAVLGVFVLFPRPAVLVGEFMRYEKGGHKSGREQDRRLGKGG